MENDPEQEVKVPNTYDRWFVAALVGAGLFALFGFVSLIPQT